MHSSFNPRILQVLDTINMRYGRGRMAAADKFPLGDRFFVQRDFQYGSDIRIGSITDLGDDRILIRFLGHRKILNLNHGVAPFHGKIVVNHTPISLP